MTSIVGVLCRDGVVIGTDGSATFGFFPGFPTIEQPTEKLVIVNNNIIIAGTGEVGLGQRFCEIIKKVPLAKLSEDANKFARYLTQEARIDLEYTKAEIGHYGALVAFHRAGEPYLCEFAVKDFQYEFKTKSLWYCSLGCAQHITDPFLGLMRDIYWQNGQPSISEAIFTVTWALEHAVNVNPGGVNNPIRLSVLEKTDEGDWKARILTDSELGESRGFIEDAKNKLREMRSELQLKSDKETPVIPPLE
jgi:20S proteasome alpha/beta subunit